MGVPRFFRWLSERYPLINQRVINQNDFDCFYLDMNGIIHTCAQNIGTYISDEEKLFQEIFLYTEYLFRIVRPRKLIFLAIDGVAPRAKMNQQRSRRFRSSYKLEISNELKIKNTDQFSSSFEKFDSNCITPGTNFMRKLSNSFKKWIKSKIKFDPEWQQGCDVIFSGPEVPGEGEHKIMNYIRKIQQIYCKTNKSALKHCLYGLDADLIMLGLVAHEKNFTLLRERLSRKEKTHSSNFHKKIEKFISDEFHLLEISLLRDMLYLEFKPKYPSPFYYDIERIIDDFIFMCMLIGNDFLPGLPHIDIASGGLNLLVRSYKEIQVKLNGYITKKFRLHLGRVEIFLEKISSEAEVLFFFQDQKKINNNENYKNHYYTSKFNLNDPGMENELVTKIKKIYMDGLHWCLFYYHKNCPSWNWFYPQYYSPLASDLKFLRIQVTIYFERGRPFEPLTQLLAVLPHGSSSFLPFSFKSLIHDEKSPVAKFYPREYKIDLNGKKNSWEGIVLLPFIDEKKLTDAVKKFSGNKILSFLEKTRNCFGKDVVFVKKINE